jgi:hypothetical protein
LPKKKIATVLSLVLILIFCFVDEAYSFGAATVKPTNQPINSHVKYSYSFGAATVKPANL